MKSSERKEREEFLADKFICLFFLKKYVYIIYSVSVFIFLKNYLKELEEEQIGERGLPSACSLPDVHNREGQA